MKNITFLITAFLIVLAACTQDVSILALPYTSKLSIQSLITPGQTPRVYLNLTVPYFDPKVLPADLFIRSATVKMSNSEGSEILLPDSVWNAYRCYFEYFYKGELEVKADKTYTLSIDYAGENFTATATTDRRKVQLDSVTYTESFRDLYGNHEGILLHFKDLAGAGEDYRNAMGRTFSPTGSIFGANGEYADCSLGKTIWLQEIGRTIYPDRNADGTAFSIIIEPAYQHKKDQIGYVRLQTMDKAAFDFYDQFDRQKLAQYNPFVEPVFIRPGQFGERAFGVFGAFAVSDSLAFVFPE